MSRFEKCTSTVKGKFVLQCAQSQVTLSTQQGLIETMLVTKAIRQSQSLENGWPIVRINLELNRA